MDDLYYSLAVGVYLWEIERDLDLEDLFFKVKYRLNFFLEFDYDLLETEGCQGCF